MDFTEVLSEPARVHWGRGYELGFRAGWLAREELGDVGISDVVRAGTCSCGHRCVLDVDAAVLE